jgi:hypothetical protein
MCVENLTYGALGARLNISAAAARSLARRLQLPRSRSEDGKALVSVDLTQIKHTPHPPGRRYAGELAELTGQVAALRADNLLLETISAGHRADFERERERAEHERARADRLMADLLQAKSDVTTSREMVARLESEIAFLRARARTDSSMDKAERHLGQLAATLVDADRKAARR